MPQLGLVLSLAGLLHQAGSTDVPTELDVLPSFVTSGGGIVTPTSEEVVHGRCELSGSFPTGATFAVYEAMLRALSEVATTVAVLDKYTLLQRNDDAGHLPHPRREQRDPSHIQQALLDEVSGDADIASLSTSSWSFHCPWTVVKIQTVEAPPDLDTGVPLFAATTQTATTATITGDPHSTTASTEDHAVATTGSGPAPTQTTTITSTTTLMACPGLLRVDGGGAESSRPEFFGLFEKANQATGALNGFRPLYKNSYSKELYYWAEHELWIISHEGGSSNYLGVVFAASDSHCPQEVTSPWMVWSRESTLWEEFPVQVSEVTTTSTTTAFLAAPRVRKEGLSATEQVILAVGIVVLVVALCVAGAFWIHYCQVHRKAGGKRKHKVRVVKEMGHAETINSMDSMDSTDLGFNHHPVHDHNHEGHDHVSEASMRSVQPGEAVRSISKQSNASSNPSHLSHRSDGAHHASLCEMRKACSPRSQSSPRSQNKAIADSAESSIPATQSSPRVADPLRQAANLSPRSEANSRAARAAAAHKDLERGELPSHQRPSMLSDDSHIPGMVAGFLEPSPRGSLMPCSQASTRGPSKDSRLQQPMSRGHSRESGLSHASLEQPSCLSAQPSCISAQPSCLSGQPSCISRPSASNLTVPGQRKTSFRDQVDQIHEVHDKHFPPHL